MTGEFSILSSVARTASTNSDNQSNYEAVGVLISVDITATPNNAETLTPSLQVRDLASGKWVTVTAFTALTASALGATPTTETYLYTLYPGAAETAATAKHEGQSLALPSTWRVRMVHSASGSWTYSVSGSVLGPAAGV